MASKTINPTRMELTRLKGRLRTAVRGHRLLKDKRDELMRQFFLIVRENKELRAKVEQGIEEANRAMTVASSVMSPEMLQQALLYPKQSATLDMTFQNIMSVSVPVYEFHTKNEDAASIYPYGFAQTSGELDDALGALASVFQDMLALAQAEKKTPPRQCAGICHDPGNGEKHQVYLHEARGKRPRYQGPPDEGQGHGAQGRARIRRLKPERRPLSQRGTA